MRLAARDGGAARWKAGAERAAGAAIRGDGRAGAAIRGAMRGGAAGRATTGAGRAAGAGRAMAAGAGRGGAAARAGAGAGRAGAAAGAPFLGGSANASPTVAVIIEMARTLAAQPAPTLHRTIVLSSHVNSHIAATCNAPTVDWFRRPSYRGTDPWWICVRSVHRPFIMALRRCDKETRVLKMRLGWSGLGVALGPAHMHSEHAN
jgi:hypothetical protein